MCPSDTAAGAGVTASHHTAKITGCVELGFTGGGETFNKELWQEQPAACQVASYPFFLGSGSLSHT